MSKEVQSERVTVLKFVNDYKMDMERLRIRSFYLFHRCQERCFSDINSQADLTETCVKNCESKLEEYFEAKKNMAPTNLEQVFTGIELVDTNMREEYIRQCWETKHKLEIYTKSLELKL
jgi:hypothetical protein